VTTHSNRLVLQHTEPRGPVRVMAPGAVLEQDRRDVFGVCHRGSRLLTRIVKRGQTAVSHGTCQPRG
jgi:hypothetical protein